MLFNVNVRSPLYVLVVSPIIAAIIVTVFVTLPIAIIQPLLHVVRGFGQAGRVTLVIAGFKAVYEAFVIDGAQVSAIGLDAKIAADQQRQDEQRAGDAFEESTALSRKRRPDAAGAGLGWGRDGRRRNCLCCCG